MKLNKLLIKIQQLLDERNWTLYRLSKESNIPYSSLNSLFLKNNQPTVSTLEKVCDGFHITLSEFFAEDTPPAPLILSVLFKSVKVSPVTLVLCASILSIMHKMSITVFDTNGILVPNMRVKETSNFINYDTPK